jgi:SPFH domain / Band 7 family
MSYYKGTPENYVVKFTGGKAAKHGRGVSFWYWKRFTTVLELPATSVLLPFIFNETTANYQDVTLQGTAQFRVNDPLVTSEKLDFKQRTLGEAAGDGREKLALLVSNLIQSHARGMVSKLQLEQMLTDVGTLSDRVFELAAADPALAGMGVALEAVHFSSAKAKPDIEKALQTEYREQIQKQADQAIFARRAAAVENEKQIKERELSTEIDLAERRKQLVETQAVNTIRIAKAEAEAAQVKLAVYKGMSPSSLASLALKDWAEKGGAIGNLTVTGDMLREIMGALGTKGK